MYKIYCRFSCRPGYILPSLYIHLDDAITYCKREASKRGIVSDGLFGPLEHFMNFEVYDFGKRFIDMSKIESASIQPVYKSYNCRIYVSNS